ncbi:MAG TPA: hypothetical protein VMH00_10755 [Candidatus Limnocylindrales bacterium]|nr:hypothetical protein [Candidatus Limnocylindrales bacterium]
MTSAPPKWGKYADVIAVEGDPLTDIAILQHLAFVVKDGRIVKDVLSRQIVSR